MHVNERREIIVEKVLTEGSIDVDLLAEELHVSNMTIRRDLDYLEKGNKIIRTFGGAIPATKIVNEETFLMKENKFSSEKKLIAKRAVLDVKNDSTILLDSGTTTLEIAKLLSRKKGITVITNDIKIAATLMDSTVKVIIVGGLLQNSTGAILGGVTEEQLKKFHVDIAFIGTHALDIDAGVTVPSLEKASLKRIMMNTAQETVIVADSSKFNLKSLMEVCKLNSVDRVITNHDPKVNYSLFEEIVVVEIAQ